MKQIKVKLTEMVTIPLVALPCINRSSCFRNRERFVAVILFHPEDWNWKSACKPVRMSLCFLFINQFCKCAWFKSQDIVKYTRITLLSAFFDQH